MRPVEVRTRHPQFLCENSRSLLHHWNNVRVLLVAKDLQPKVWLPVLCVELDNLNGNILLVCQCTRIPDTSTEIARPLGVGRDTTEVDGV